MDSGWHILDVLGSTLAIFNCQSLLMRLFCQQTVVVKLLCSRPNSSILHVFALWHCRRAAGFGRTWMQSCCHSVNCRVSWLSARRFCDWDLIYRCGGSSVMVQSAASECEAHPVGLFLPQILVLCQLTYSKISQAVSFNSSVQGAMHKKINRTANVQFSVRAEEDKCSLSFLFFSSKNQADVVEEIKILEFIRTQLRSTRARLL